MFKEQSGVEAVVATLGLLTAAALVTAFIYDSVYFLVLSPTLLQLLTLSDHVETAIAVVPWMVCLTLATMSCLVITPDLRRHLAALIIFGLAAAAFLAANVYYFGAEIWATYGRTGLVVFLVSVAVIATFAIYLRTRRAAQTERSIELKSALGFAPATLIALMTVYWVTGTVICGASNAQADNTPEVEQNGRTRFTLTLKDDSTITTARIARMIEKGAILVTPSRSLVQFVPMDHIRRIDIIHGGVVIPQG